MTTSTVARRSARATGSTPPGFWDPFNDRFTPVKGLRTPKQRSSAASCFVGDMRNQRMLVMGGGSPAVNTTDRIKLSAAKSEASFPARP